MAVNEFDFVAPFYDRLARLVFGKALILAQITHLSEIKENDNVLILGGGTGEILEHIPICKSIDYVEKSKQMIHFAKKRSIKRGVNFIQEDFFGFEPLKKYNIIICPFFLDCFDESSLKLAIGKCKQLLNMNGRLLVTDFHYEQSSNFLLKLMHWFFKLTSQLESTELKDIHQFLIVGGFHEKSINFFEQGIFRAVYVLAMRK